MNASLGGVSDWLHVFLPLMCFKIRISLLHNVATYVKFCLVSWSLCPGPLLPYHRLNALQGRKTKNKTHSLLQPIQ